MAHHSKWPSVLGWINIGLGVILFAGYGAYLLLHQRHALAGTQDPGMILYALAVAGSVFVAWGLILRGAALDAVPRARILQASATGFLLLGLMRIGTALFPHGVFIEMVALPAVEAAVFLLLAWLLYQSAGGRKTA